MYRVAIFEYLRHEKDPKVDIRTPILFDATWSRIQHLSSLTTGIEIAKLVNVLEGNTKRPSGFYSVCAEAIKEAIIKLPDEDKIFKDKVLTLN